jgi:hypothetical protein
MGIKIESNHLKEEVSLPITLWTNLHNGHKSKYFVKNVHVVDIKMSVDFVRTVHGIF